MTVSGPWSIQRDTFGVLRVWGNKNVVINGVDCGNETVDICAVEEEEYGRLIVKALELLESLGPS